jgi:uncharacterized HAD superfamily protein
LRIAVDVDGVLADTMVSVCKILNERRSTQFSVESFDQWNAWMIAGITRDEFFRTLDEAWFSWQRIPPTEEDLSKKVERLKDFGKIDIVTGRSPITVPYAKLWMERYDITFDSFVVTKDSTKGKARLNYDLYIDDNAELMTLLSSRLHGAGILYQQPWNRKAAPMPRIFRVRRWDEIPTVIEQSGI